MSYKMLCTRPEIRLGKGIPRITEKGKQFEVPDEVTRDLLIANGNAIDITDGMPEESAGNRDILVFQIENEKLKNKELAKKVQKYRQLLKQAGINPDEEVEGEDEESEPKSDEEKSKDNDEDLSPEAAAIVSV